MPRSGSRFRLRRPSRSSLALVSALGGAVFGLLMYEGEVPASERSGGSSDQPAPAKDAALGPVTTSSPVAVPVAKVVPLAPVASATQAVPVGARTPLEEEQAAVYLAQAWLSVAGAVPTAETLAVLWAQWAHETGRGRRMRGYNFAGIKGNGPEGESFVAWTREVTPSPEQRTRETFRAYSTPQSGAYDYVRLISKRYPAAFRAAVRGDVTRFVRALDLGGYFTDSDRAYSRALSSLARECLDRSVPQRALEAVAGVGLTGSRPQAL